MSLSTYIGFSRDLKVVLKGETSNDIIEPSSQEDVKNYLKEFVNKIHIYDIDRNKESVLKHFSNEYVYELFDVFYSYTWRCELINYIKENVGAEEYVELYSCWSGDEMIKRNQLLDKVIYLDKLESIEEFELEESQYMKVYVKQL